MRLLSSGGELVRGRCKSTNLCDYCAKLSAVETSEMLALDALKGNAPTIWCVLTTSKPSVEPSDFYEARRKVVTALKRRWPTAEYLCVLEYTAGWTRRSRGRRFPHWNILLKNVPAAHVEEARAIIKRVWCSRAEVGANPDAQYVGLIEHQGGLMRYLALHFLKESQRPPANWRGHRVTKSRGYLTEATADARAEARESLAFKRDLWRALNSGASPAQAEELAQDAKLVRKATTWRITIAAPVGLTADELATQEDRAKHEADAWWRVHVPSEELKPEACAVDAPRRRAWLGRWRDHLDVAAAERDAVCAANIAVKAPEGTRRVRCDSGRADVPPDPGGCSHASPLWIGLNIDPLNSL
jgi:hypothetical protein